MRYFCRLVTPPKGVILDPYMGSGTTGKGAVLEGFDFFGIERESPHFKVAEARITNYEDLEDYSEDIETGVAQLTLDSLDIS